MSAVSQLSTLKYLKFLEMNQYIVEEQCAWINSSVQSQAEREYDEPVSVEQYLKRRETNIGFYALQAMIQQVEILETPMWIQLVIRQAMQIS